MCNVFYMICMDDYDNNILESFDSVSLGHEDMYNFIVDSGATTFFEFYSYFRSNYSEDKSIYSELGKLLEYHNFTTSAPVTSKITQMCPSFEWHWFESLEANYYTNRMFKLNFYDYDRDLILQTDYFSSGDTLTEDEWTEIINASYYFYVSVTIYEVTDYESYYESEWTYYPRPVVGNACYNEPIGNTFYGNDCYWYVFIAPQTETYTIQSTGNVDTYGEIFSEVVAGKSLNGLIVGDDNSGENNNFLLTYSLKVGERIYIRVSTVGWNKTGAFEILVSSEVHNHNYTYSYSQYDGVNHIAYCACGDSRIETHNYVVFKNGYKCNRCLNYTLGPIITPLLDDDVILYTEEKKEDIIEV